MITRNITPNLLAALKDTPVVVLHGARQVGKSTLAQHLAEKEYPARYLTLDQAGTLSAARTDPEGFLAELSGPVVIDEIQRAPELLIAIKAEVDRARRPGRYLLTGSANVLQLPRLADSLAGRIEILMLWPFSQGELSGVRESFIDALFAKKLPDPPRGSKKARRLSKTHLMKQILVGGYPEAVARKTEQRRRDWYEAYLGTILMRDVRDLANISGLSDLPRLLSVLAGRAAGLLNYAEIGRDTGLNQMTVKRYFSLLQATFLVRTVRPWFTNRTKRVVKSEKLYLGDTGLLAHLLDITADRLKADTQAAGIMLENFVAVELMKQKTWSKTRPEILHFRGYRDIEVDLVLEAPGGHKLVGVEVKSSATIDADDFRGLRLLAEAAGKRFHRGIVLYPGSEVIPFGRGLHAVPVGSLWQVAVRTRAGAKS